MKTIPLTKGQVAKVDDDDYARISAHKWQAQWLPNSRTFRAVRNERGMHVMMHREVMRALPGERVDHKDHDTLDNRKSQLRLCTQRQNKQNSRCYRNNKSGLKGVDKVKKRWRARIRSEGVRACIGFFDSRAEAALAYDTAAKALFREFAHANFRDEDAWLLRKLIAQLHRNRRDISREKDSSPGTDQRVWSEHMDELEALIDRTATEMSRTNGRT